MVENMGIGIDVSGADFNFVNSGRCGIQAVDNGTLTTVNLHTLIVTAAISKSGNLEADRNLIFHIRHVVAEIVHIYFSYAFAVQQRTLVYVSTGMSHNTCIFFVRHKSYQIQGMASQISQSTCTGSALDIAPY